MTIAEALSAAIDDAGWRNAPAGDPANAEEYLALLRPLYAAGRRDLPLGRLLEGHVDAVQIVRRYATAEQAAALARALAGGGMLGVWNAGLANEPLTWRDGRLSGGKSYASGAGVLTHALVTAVTAVTADTDAGAQMLLIDLAATPPAIDRDWWLTTGMQRSETHQVRWREAAVDPASAIGVAEDYAREPWFSGGALRFAAVQAGGVAGLFDLTRAHLVANGRDGDVFQSARLAELFALADGAVGALTRTAAAWFEGEEEARLARVASARLVVAEAAERALALAQQAVGLQGMFLAHPLSAMLADLSVYLRQPAPDAQRLRVGRAAAAGAITPAL